MLIISLFPAFTEEEEIDKFIAESGIMVNFDHPNILRLVGICFNMEDNLPAIVLPYMANGDLRSFLREKKAEMITSCDDNERYPPVSKVTNFYNLTIAFELHHSLKLVDKNLLASHNVTYTIYIFFI